jgi:hypothetical protein
LIFFSRGGTGGAAAGVGDPPRQGPLVLVEGMVEDSHGIPVVVDARVRRPLPGDGEQNGRVGEHRLRLVRPASG